MYLISVKLLNLATCVHLSTHLLFVVNLSPFKSFNAESAVFKHTASVNTDLKSPDKEIKRKKQKRKEKDFNLQ